jgi:sigma-B regulation protein RsbU (phosphoserine phosphatase)
MIRAPIPVNEAERVADLRALAILDTRPEERFDRLVQLAAHIFDVPIAYVALVDSDRQWFKAKCGLTVDETGREVSFCGHAIMQSDTMIVPDACEDERFSDNPFVLNPPNIRFYAGHPLAGRAGHNVGTFCIADSQPRQLDAGQIATLQQLADLAKHELNLIDLISTQRDLIETQAMLAHELAEAARFVRALLPPRLEGRVRTDYQFVASSQLGGDLLGYHWLDDERLALYLLDVCGHGVGPALLSMSVHTALRRKTLPDTRFDRPAEVLTALNRAFPMAEHDNKYFTIWYGVYDVKTRALRYAGGGHPPALLTEGTSGFVRLETPDLIVGVSPDVTYKTRECEVPVESRLYLFSDGAFEIPRPDGEMLMIDGLSDLIRQADDRGASRVERVLKELQELNGSPDFEDDVSLLETEFL